MNYRAPSLTLFSKIATQFEFEIESVRKSNDLFLFYCFSSPLPDGFARHYFFILFFLKLCYFYSIFIISLEHGDMFSSFTHIPHIALAVVSMVVLWRCATCLSSFPS